MTDTDDGGPKIDSSGLDLSFLRDVNEAVPNVAKLVAAIRVVMEAARPRLQELGAMIGNAQALIDHWEKNAPAILNDAIGSRGLIVPLSQMALPDLAELLKLYHDGGDRAVTDRITLYYDQIFDIPDFLKKLGAAWTARPSLHRRLPLLLQALKAHELQLFAVSVPTLLAQFEGVVADMASHAGKMNFVELREHVSSLAGRTVAGDILNVFVSDALLARFHHGSLVPPFSRHAILHGGDVGYATETNSRTAILLVDQISELEERDTAPLTVFGS
jgi:hypothetical protein